MCLILLINKQVALQDNLEVSLKYLKIFEKPVYLKILNIILVCFHFFYNLLNVYHLQIVYIS